ncbi:MAG: peptide ABC transporter ATP-binding protein [Candidatus Puniceispirillum sp.]|nr:peptide ABC transporter ATP-binding protein [Candidatus Pelagibacter sp.]MBA4283095.1 peptide ABC transporter ATP-binding protein [Candidatus Puniceispirillum sp.]
MLHIKNLSLQLNSRTILSDITTDISSDKIYAILGPSGSGKTSLLRCISQLEQNYSGTLRLNQKPLQQLSKGQIGMVFQQFALFENMTVEQNICLAPQLTEQSSKEQIQKKYNEYIEQFNLQNLTHYFPCHLSGGQKQRVAIVRMLMMNPHIILFDEPTSALDIENVKDVIDLISALKGKEKIIIVVTHDVHFAKSIASDIIFLHDGEINQIASKDDFFSLDHRKGLSPKAQQFLLNCSV